MSDIEDLSPDAAEFRCIVPFPDGSASFVNGFEAGIVWQRMNAGETEIESPIAYHIDNHLVFDRMAAAQGYDIEFEPCLDNGRVCGTWELVTFTKRRKRFSVIQGGVPSPSPEQEEGGE